MRKIEVGQRYQSRVTALVYDVTALHGRKVFVTTCDILGNWFTRSELHAMEKLD
jgi:hypothetical protein